LQQQLPSLPQQAILPSALSWLQQAQVLVGSLAGGGVVWVALWAIRARAMTKVLKITRSFVFIVSSEFGYADFVFRSVA
jgi:hypothetical protein